MIYNHKSAKLSELDMMMVRSIPQGGNWKNIPESVPSKRLDRIRADYAAGKGSRSTYYGRLKSDRPAYTINTYFNRPGNGCHIHYGQDRVLSQREAARLQSFPDSFKFLGPQGAVNNQIGNAVPPLLSYQLALSFGQAGQFVDLFSGAGGLGLGFTWAGWRPVVANDIDKHCLATYQANVHREVVEGDISLGHVRNAIKRAASQARSSGGPLWVLGGPPCQGFSTAGFRKSDDHRSELVWDYIKMLRELQPDGFVFENVTGLINMRGGEVFRELKEALEKVAPSVSAWVLSTENYGIPQKRARVVIVGGKDLLMGVQRPQPISSLGCKNTLLEGLCEPPSVFEALSDLPEIPAGGGDGAITYATPPSSIYQRFMRGEIGPREYVEAVKGF